METWYYSRQEGILKAVKEALRPYRYTRDTLAETFAKADEEADRLLLEDDGEDQQIVDHDALEKAMHSAIQSQRREGNAFVRPVNDLIESGDLILHTVNPSAATRGEIEPCLVW
jgi:UDP-N-acetylmuramate-alanine ligase